MPSINVYKALKRFDFMRNLSEGFSVKNVRQNLPGYLANQGQAIKDRSQRLFDSLADNEGFIQKHYDPTDPGFDSSVGLEPAPALGGSELTKIISVVSPNMRLSNALVPEANEIGGLLVEQPYFKVKNHFGMEDAFSLELLSKADWRRSEVFRTQTINDNFVNLQRSMSGKQPLTSPGFFDLQKSKLSSFGQKLQGQKRRMEPEEWKDVIVNGLKGDELITMPHFLGMIDEALRLEDLSKVKVTEVRNATIEIRNSLREYFDKLVENGDLANISKMSDKDVVELYKLNDIEVPDDPELLQQFLAKERAASEAALNTYVPRNYILPQIKNRRAEFEGILSEYWYGKRMQSFSLNDEFNRLPKDDMLKMLDEAKIQILNNKGEPLNLVQRQGLSKEEILLAIPEDDLRKLQTPLEKRIREELNNAASETAETIMRDPFGFYATGQKVRAGIPSPLHRRVVDIDERLIWDFLEHDPMQYMNRYEQRIIPHLHGSKIFRDYILKKGIVSIDIKSELAKMTKGDIQNLASQIGRDLNVENALKNDLIEGFSDQELLKMRDILLKDKVKKIDSPIDTVLEWVNDRFRDKIRSDTVNQAVNEKIRRNVNRDLRHLADAALNMNRHIDPASFWTTATANVRKLNTIRFLTQYVISSVGDLMRPAMRYGFKAWGDSLSVSMKNLDGIKKERKYFEDIGIGAEIILGDSMSRYDDLIKFADTGTLFNKAIDNVYKPFGLISMGDAWNSWVKQLSGLTASHFTIRAAKKLSKKQKLDAIEKNLIANMGLTEKDLLGIYQQWSKNGEIYDGFHLARLDRWDDSAQGLRRKYETALLREVDRVIVSASKGTAPIWTTSSNLGLLINQFRSYMWNSAQMVSLAGLQQGDRNFMMAASGMIFLGGVAHVAKARVNGYDIDYDNKGELLINSIERSGVMAWLFDANMILERATQGNIGINPMLGGTELSRYKKRDLAGVLFGPSYQRLQEIGDITGGAAAFITGNEVDNFQQSAMMRNIPYSNTAYVRGLGEIINNSVGEQP